MFGIKWDPVKDLSEAARGGGYVTRALLGTDQKEDKFKAPAPGTAVKNITNEFEQGKKYGSDIYRDKEMMDARNRLQDLSKGYSGQELGALREGAAQETAGQRASYLQQLQARAGRAGIGGARAAAMQGAADVGFQKAKQDAERKILLDNAQLTRQGTQDFNDFMMKQKAGELGTGALFAQLGSSERGSNTAAAAAAKEPKRGILGNLLSGLF